MKNVLNDIAKKIMIHLIMFLVISFRVEMKISMGPLPQLEKRLKNLKLKSHAKKFKDIDLE